MSLETVLVLEGGEALGVPDSLGNEGKVYGRGFAYGWDFIQGLTLKLGLKEWAGLHTQFDRIMDEIGEELGESETADEEDAHYEEYLRRAPWFSAEESLPEFEQMLEHLQKNEEKSREAIHRSGSGYDSMVWDFRVAVELLRQAARDGKRFHLSVC